MTCVSVAQPRGRGWKISMCLVLCRLLAKHPCSPSRSRILGYLGRIHTSRSCKMPNFCQQFTLHRFTSKTCHQISSSHWLCSSSVNGASPPFTTSRTNGKEPVISCTPSTKPSKYGLARLKKSAATSTEKAARIFHPKHPAGQPLDANHGLFNRLQDFKQLQRKGLRHFYTGRIYTAYTAKLYTRLQRQTFPEKENTQYDVYRSIQHASIPLTIKNNLKYTYIYIYMWYWYYIFILTHFRKVTLWQSLDFKTPHPFCHPPKKSRCTLATRSLSGLGTSLYRFKLGT